MTTYLDTSAPGGSPITASGTVKEFGGEVDFYISVASNLIAGQATGPSVLFYVYSKKIGIQQFSVDYGTTNANFAVKWSGYMVEAVVPTTGGAVSCRVSINSEPTPISVTTVGSNPLSSQPTVAVLYVQAQAAIANSVKKTQTGGSSMTLPALAVTTGQLVLVCVALNANANPGATVSDSQGNTYATLATGTGGIKSPGNLLTVFQAVAGATGNDTITVNFTGSVLGQETAIAFGATTAIDGVGAVGNTSSSSCPTTTPGDQVVCVTYGAQPSGFNLIQSESPFLTVGSRVQLTVGQVSAPTTGLSVLFSISGSLLPAVADSNGTIKVDTGGGGTGVSSLNGETGAVTLESTGGTLQVTTPSGSTINHDLTNPLPAGSLAIQGSGAGGTNIASAEAGAGSHTQTFPAKTGTVADTSDIPAAASTVTGPDSFGDSAVVGTSANYAREDHNHGLPSAPSGSAKTLLVGAFTGNTVTTTVLYSAFGGGAPSNNTGRFTVIPYNGTLKNLNVVVDTNTLSGSDTYTVTVAVYDSPGGTLKSNAITVTFSGGGTGVKADLTHTASVTAGWVVQVTWVSNAGTGSLGASVSLELDAS